MRKDENGFIVFEATLALALYTTLILSILSIVNIVTLQARMHYALTQTSITVSMYSYMFEVTGIADRLRTADRLATSGREEIRGTIEDAQRVGQMLDGLRDIGNVNDIDIEGFVDVGTDVWERVDNWLEDPVGLLQKLANAGLDELRNLITELMLRPLMNMYLRNGDMTGDEYLKSMNVINGVSGINFRDTGDFLNSITVPEGNRTVIIDQKGDIKIFIQYEVDYTFGILPLPFTKVVINQSVSTKAWLSGYGDGYKN
jgi:hypothetical protein